MISFYNKEKKKVIFENKAEQWLSCSKPKLLTSSPPLQFPTVRNALVQYLRTSGHDDFKGSEECTGLLKI